MTIFSFIKVNLMNYCQSYWTKKTWELFSELWTLKLITYFPSNGTLNSVTPLVMTICKNVFRGHE